MTVFASPNAAIQPPQDRADIGHLALCGKVNSGKSRVLAMPECEHVWEPVVPGIAWSCEYCGCWTHQMVGGGQ